MEPLFKKKRPPYLGVSGQRRLGQISKERKDLYAGFSLEGIRRDLIEQTGGLEVPSPARRQRLERLEVPD